MKNKLLLSACLLLSSFLLHAQSQNDILGLWQSDDHTKIVEVYKQNNLYFARLIDLKDPEHGFTAQDDDRNNESAMLRRRKLGGITLWSNFQWNSKNKYWENGSIYNELNGRTYNGRIKLEEGRLKLTGYYGILFFLGKTKTFVKTTDKHL